MAESLNPTTLVNMVDPEVMAPMISAQLPTFLVFANLAPIDNSLEGRPGSKITVPRFLYSGDAKNVAEGEAINYDKLETGTSELTITKIGKGISITDEALLSGLGDPVAEGRRQIAMAIAAKIDTDVLNTALEARLTIPEPAALDASLIDSIENAFDSDDSQYAYESDASNSAGVLLMNPADMRKLRAAIVKTDAGDWTRQTELGDNVLVSGAIGRVLGWEIKTAKKIPVGTQIAIKAGALRTYLKRGLNAESGRDMDRKITKFNADQIYGVSIYDDTKLLVVGATDEVAGNEAQDAAKKPTSPRGSRRAKSIVETATDPDTGDGTDSGK